MLRRGDWITPTYNGVPWFEKPILAYWLAMPTVAIFDNEFGARLPSVACSLATVFLIYRFVARHRKVEDARLVAVAYSGSLLVAGLGRMMMTDAPLVLCLTVALTQFYESLVGDVRRRWISAAAVGVGILAKGPVAAILFLGVIGVLAWLSPGLRPRFKGGWLIGLAICVGVVATWYVPCYLANGQTFIDKFLIEQNIGRFAGGDKAHRVPIFLHPVYFPLIIFLGALPWSGWSLRAGVWSRKAFAGRTQYESFLWAWFLVPLIFFTISGTKLPHYILPAIAPLIMLVVPAIAERHRSNLSHGEWTQIAAAWTVVVFSVAASVSHKTWDGQTKEVQAMAKFAWAERRPLAVYEIGRGNEDIEIGLRLQQTSHPSVLFYYKKPILMTDRIADLVEKGDETWLITREGRLADDELAVVAAAGWLLEPVKTPFAQDRYRLLSLSPSVVGQ